MEIVVAVLFGCAALGGLFMLTLRLKGGNPPTALATLHGLLAASGLVALVILMATTGFQVARGIALALLVVAAALGATMAFRHRKGHLISLGGVFVHFLIAFLALSILAVGLFG